MVTTLALALGAVGFVAGLGVGGFGYRQFAGGDSSTPLARPARTLDTDPDPDAVASAVDDVVGAVETVARAGEFPDDVSVSRTDPPADQARTIERAVSDREVVVTAPADASAASDPLSPSGSESASGARSNAGDGVATPLDADPTEPAGGDGPSKDHISEAAQAVERTHPPQVRETERLLAYLSDPDGVDQRRLEETLTSVVETVAAHDELEAALSRVDTASIDSVYDATTVRDALEAVDDRVAQAVRELADGYATTVEAAEECQSDLDAVERAAGDLVAAAAEQTTVDLSGDDTTRGRLAALSAAIDRGEVVFRADEERAERVVTDVEQRVGPESSLARDLVDQLAERRTVDEREFETTLTRVLEALDEAETVRHRLGDVDHEAVLDTADRLADDLDRSDPVEGLLADRVDELADTVERANEADTVVVYAARRELSYYDRTFLPLYRDRDAADAADAGLQQRLSAVEERRSEIRTSYPTRYPEHNHTIPIHFLELVEALHEDASDARADGEPERAEGLLTAAELAMDWVEELYERHAYSVLLQQLRG